MTKILWVRYDATSINYQEISCRVWMPKTFGIKNRKLSIRCGFLSNDVKVAIDGHPGT